MSEPCHAIVFRDVTENICTADAVKSLTAEMRSFAVDPNNQEALLSALLRVGELHCALLEKHHNRLMGVTTRCLAEIAAGYNGDTTRIILSDEERIRRLRLPDTLRVSRPEGFAFYGIHPLDYSDAIMTAGLRDDPVMVIGIRSIGSTLSEVVAATLNHVRKQERTVMHMTVRPSGHPYDRKCPLPQDYLAEIKKNKDAKFVVVDEGPGLSGSSFLSVGEALVEIGIAHSQILFLGSREVDPATLVTPSGAERWRRFQTLVAPRNHMLPEVDAIPVAAGVWRKWAEPLESKWPGLWTSMLPAVFRSRTTDRVFEYHGLGHYGKKVRERIDVLAEAGFTRAAAPAANGFSRMVPESGCRLVKQELSANIIERMAEYLAFRAKAFAVGADQVHTADLEEMARFNFSEATARNLPADFHLQVYSPAIADAQMMPYSWLRPFSRDTPLLKLDCATHGDNHFFPGPVDIAWDVAGAIVEWEMQGQNSEFFIACFDQLAKDEISGRLQNYLVAYAAFRNGYCRMGAFAMTHDEGESSRLLRDAAKYREVLERLVPEKKLAAVQLGLNLAP